MRVSDYLVGATFFSHFCGGVSTEELVPVIGRLRKNKIGTILDYAAEADVSSEAGARGAGGDKACDENARTLIGAIEACASTRVDGEHTFAAMKVTGLGSPELLEKVTSLIVKHSHHPSIAAPTHSEILAALSPAEADGFRRVGARLEEIAGVAEERGVMLLVDAEQTYMQGAIDHLALNAMARHNRARSVVFNTYQCYLKDSESRVARDAERAEREGFVFAAKLVRGAYMVQERALALKHARPSPIHPDADATHRCYNSVVASLLRRVAQGRTSAFGEEGEEGGARAARRLEPFSLASEAPLEPFSLTSGEPLEPFLSGAARRAAGGVMVASHNEASVRQAAALLEELSVPKHGAGVYFSQLKGMCDHISFGLGAHDFQVFKYVPYGPVREVMPYLLRRAEENADVMSGASSEVRALAGELRRRLSFWGQRDILHGG